ncbi:hypothetical protein Pint_35242 [Pistacia integerrima]|uniref:Uncharacterized protein n=1 Tax=Pistacia integerrima TaxID=434235 RepID=A0ACC0Y1L2_9ROSI|nr:hypothetical protein Pint_35242 [Pistacia integerrima]
MASQEPLLLENGNLKGLSKENRHGRTAHNMSSSSLRKKSDLTLVSKVPCNFLRKSLANLQEVFLGTKLSVLFPAIPVTIIARCYGFGRPWVFGLSLLGLTPLAERVSFLTEQIAYYSGPTRYAGASAALTADPTLQLSRAASIVMLIAYLVYIIFQLWTHRELFEAQEDSEVDDGVSSEEVPVIGVLEWICLADWDDFFHCSIVRIRCGHHLGCFRTWGIFVSFISIILLPTVGNAAEHAGAVIFAFKNKLVSNITALIFISFFIKT